MGAVKPLERKAATKVVVFQCPHGALPINHRFFAHRP